MFIRKMWPVWLTLAALAGEAQILNRNLVINGEAESQPAADVPGWTVSGGLHVADYGGSNLLTLSDYGPAERGNSFFIGGPGNSPATAVQVIDVTGAAPF